MENLPWTIILPTMWAASYLNQVITTAQQLMSNF